MGTELKQGSFGVRVMKVTAAQTCKVLGVCVFEEKKIIGPVFNLVAFVSNLNVSVCS